MSEEMSGESSASGPPSQLKQDWHSVRPLFAPLLSGRNLPANAKTAEHQDGLTSRKRGKISSRGAGQHGKNDDTKGQEHSTQA
jgi:hypothetical protein